MTLELDIHDLVGCPHNGDEVSEVVDTDIIKGVPVMKVRTCVYPDPLTHIWIQQKDSFALQPTTSLWITQSGWFRWKDIL